MTKLLEKKKPGSNFEIFGKTDFSEKKVELKFFWTKKNFCWGIFHFF